MRKFLLVLLSAASMCAMAQYETKSCREWYDVFLSAMDTVHSFTQTGSVDSMPQIRIYLDQWATGKPDCVDRYTAEFNYCFNRAIIPSLQTTVGLPPYVEQRMTLTDSTGNVAGYLYQGYYMADSLLWVEGNHWLDSALALHPERIDIWQGEIMSYLYADDLDGMMRVFDRFLSYSVKHDGAWLSAYDEEVQRKEPVVETLQDRLNTLAENGYLDEGEALVKLALKYYPKSPIYTNDIAVINYARGDLENALLWMQKAAELDPKDKLIKNNIKHLKKTIQSEKKRK